MNQLRELLVLLFITVMACDACYYRKFTAHHTACQPRNPSCHLLDNRVTNNDKNLILRLHNYYREKVALGKEGSAGGMPSASNMREMVWDNELAMIAQKHAERCQFAHDCNSCRKVDRFGVGQNLYTMWSTNYPSSNGQWEGMMKAFYNEVQLFRKEYISPFKFQKSYGHLTQMVWADTWKVGCGKAVFKNGKWYQALLTCNYGPAGNIARYPMYKFGRPCSACPHNTCCGDSCRRFGIHTNYRGLCRKR